jgi:hypothetical protein
MNVRSPGGAWSPDQAAPSPVFAKDSVVPFDLDDWTAAVQYDKTVHAVRRLNTGVFEHRVMSTLGKWENAPTGTPIPQMNTLPASGLVLVPYGDSMILLALSNDDGHSILYTTYDGTNWSATWSTLVPPTGVTRDFLAGYAPDSGAKPAVIWTETSSGNVAISGALLP